MSDELVERLRSDWFGYDVSLKAIDAMEEAADRIEQLTAERDSLLAGHRTLNIDGARLETRIEKLIAEREMAANWWKEAVELTQQARLQYSEEKARADKAEAERDEAWAMVAKADTQMGQSLADYLQAKVDNTRLREALEVCVASIEHADMSDGVCCCGEEIEGHSDPMHSGHTPVDMGEYHAARAIEKARAALKGETT